MLYLYIVSCLITSLVRNHMLFTNNVLNPTVGFEYNGQKRVRKSQVERNLKGICIWEYSKLWVSVLVSRNTRTRSRVEDARNAFTTWRDNSCESRLPLTVEPGLKLTGSWAHVRVLSLPIPFWCVSFAACTYVNVIRMHVKIMCNPTT